MGWGWLLLALAACAPPPAKAVGSTQEPPESAPISPATARVHPAPPPVPDDVVERAALPFHAVRSTNAEPLDPTEFWNELAESDVVCVAEQHDNPHHHFAQLFVIQELARRSASSGRELGVGFEMFEARFQEKLSQYASGKLHLHELLEATEYEARWGYPFQYYEPQIDHAVDQGSALVALNASREQVKRVARDGFAALSDREKRLLGGYDLDDSEHRAQFDALMQGHPSMGNMDHLYAAQVLWDESMAEAAASWLGARAPARQLVILAGSAHCHKSAIPARIQRRLQLKVAGVEPVVVSENQEASELTRELVGYDYGFVMTPAP